MLTEHIAVMDLMALADALLLPEDDLALATVLRSPLFGFSDEQLFAVAWDRGRQSLRESLRNKAAENTVFGVANQLLDKLAEDARAKTPFAFYGEVLGAGRGRHRLLSRLGLEANDALDEFLNLALEYEKRETPSLQGFLAWLRDARAEVKRDMEIARDEVRVMTVHGAKGLEAPIVILADTTTPPAGPRHPRLLTLNSKATIWAGRKAHDAPPVAVARQNALDEAEHEYRRLLYVAMTRAADRLIVCGAKGPNKIPDGCWYSLIRRGLDPFLSAEKDGDDTVLRFRKTPPTLGSSRASATGVQDAPMTALPAWLRETAPSQTPRTAPLSPSAASEEGIARPYPAASAADRQKALARGRIAHRLMQALPDIPPPRRKDAAERYLAGAKGLLPEERAEIERQALAILDSAELAGLFVSGSRAEVPIVGRIAVAGHDTIDVAGQVDRLAVNDDVVLICDYKTDGVVPRRLDEVPRAYVGQFALYHAILTRLYPGKLVRAVLIFTAGPVPIEVPVALMESELRLTIMGSRHGP
jgi:ATP-dependent helicase/nuclease subunit A